MSPSPQPQPPARALSAGRRLLTWCVLTVLAGLLALPAPAAPTEFQVKAAFLFNFVKFTQWPAATFTNAAAPLVIAVAGEDPFGGILDELVRGELVGGHPLLVKHLQPGDDPAACHVLFLSRSVAERLPALLEALKHKPVLTVSDIGQFCQRGGMVNLALSSERTVRPEINPDCARAAGVEISSRLLNLSVVRLVKSAP